MCNVPPLGAYIKGTNEYIYPKIATKTTKYECPSCHKDLMIKKGSIRIHHFAHCRSDSPCNYYSRPSESDIHKDAKILLKTLLERKTKITIERKCCGEYEIPIIKDSSKIVLEHRFEYDGLKIADVAYLDQYDDSPEITYIFEICHTHKTDNDKRPEPWFEINASKLLQIANSDVDTITIPCVRKDKCTWCLKKDELRKLEPSRRIYVDIPYEDREYARDMGMQFDFRKYRKWMMWDSNINKDIILSKYKEIKYGDQIDYANKIKFIRELIKPENEYNLNPFVRIKLGQKTFFPTSKLLSVTQIDSDNEIKYIYKYNHEYDRSYKEFDFDARYDNDKIKNNKELIDIFNEYLFGKRCIIYSRKQYVYVYIIKGSNYDKYDYYGFNHFDKKVRRNLYCLPYPYLHCEIYYEEDTVTIIKHTLKTCMYISDIIWAGYKPSKHYGIDIPLHP